MTANSELLNRLADDLETDPGFAASYQLSKAAFRTAFLAAKVGSVGSQAELDAILATLAYVQEGTRLVNEEIDALNTAIIGFAVYTAIVQGQIQTIQREINKLITLTFLGCQFSIGSQTVTRPAGGFSTDLETRAITKTTGAALQANTVVQSVTSATTLILDKPYQGATQSGTASIAPLNGGVSAAVAAAANRQALVNALHFLAPASASPYGVIDATTALNSALAAVSSGSSLGTVRTFHLWPGATYLVEAAVWVMSSKDWVDVEFNNATVAAKPAQIVTGVSNTNANTWVTGFAPGVVTTNWLVAGFTPTGGGGGTSNPPAGQAKTVIVPNNGVSAGSYGRYFNEILEVDVAGQRVRTRAAANSPRTGTFLIVTGNRDRSQFHWSNDCDHSTVRGGMIVGRHRPPATLPTNPETDAQWQSYDFSLEGQSCIDINGGSYLTVENMLLGNAFGDGIYWGGQGAATNHFTVARNNIVRWCAREAFAPVQGLDIEIGPGNDARASRRNHIDMEPLLPTSPPVNRVRIHNNTFGLSKFGLVAAVSWGRVDNVVIEDNTLVDGMSLGIVSESRLYWDQNDQGVYPNGQVNPHYLQESGKRVGWVVRRNISAPGSPSYSNGFGRMGAIDGHTDLEYQDNAVPFDTSNMTYVRAKFLTDGGDGIYGNERVTGVGLRQADVGTGLPIQTVPNPDQPVHTTPIPIPWSRTGPPGPTQTYVIGSTNRAGGYNPSFDELETHLSGKKLGGRHFYEGNLAVGGTVSAGTLALLDDCIADAEQPCVSVNICELDRGNAAFTTFLQTLEARFVNPTQRARGGILVIDHEPTQKSLVEGRFTLAEYKAIFARMGNLAKYGNVAGSPGIGLAPSWKIAPVFMAADFQLGVNTDGTLRARHPKNWLPVATCYDYFGVDGYDNGSPGNRKTFLQIFHPSEGTYGTPPVANPPGTKSALGLARLLSKNLFVGETGCPDPNSPLCVCGTGGCGSGSTDPPSCKDSASPAGWRATFLNGIKQACEDNQDIVRVDWFNSNASGLAAPNAPPESWALGSSTFSYNAFAAILPTP